MKDKENLLKELEEKKNKFKILNNKINKINKKEENYTKNQERKKRVHKLIQLGVLFEMLNLEDEEKDTLIGFLINFKKLTLDQKEILKNKGKIFFEKRKKIIEISKEQIMELLKIYNQKNLDLMVIIKKEFNKNSLENLTFEEYLVLKNISKN
jgi:predicted nuclease with TOPRIM domain